MDKKQLFLNEVTNHIKSKEAQKYVADELSYHVKEAKKRLMEKGLTEAEAEEKAVEQMGSPTKLGQQLNKLHRPKVDWVLVLLLTATLFLGFLPLFSLGYMDERYFSINKTVIVLLGGAAAIGIMLIDYRKWQKWCWMFYAIGILILVMLRFFVSTMVNGVPIFRISPVSIESTMAIPFFFLSWASLFNNRKLRLWQFFILFLIPLSLFLAMPSLVNSYIYTIMVFVMLCWSKFSRKAIITIWAVASGIPVMIGLVFWRSIKLYQFERLLAFLHPEKYQNGAGYLYLHLKALLAKAGWFGNHGGKDFIPEAHTNFVFASLIYHYGWVFAIGLVIILTLLGLRIIMVSLKIKDSYSKLLLSGAFALYSVQLVTHIFMTLGLFPIISISLPFISYGLMPTVSNAILIGVVLSVYRRKDLTISQQILEK
ncbi:FtsW/RodA/SpoVE family cell cycle protein [Neobacillus mesonae]|uniref:FtsW/RodA/SpoVE family cell cycle protein n=1 Tax=Neobacillus mesonae TaxID=1193713 RepID=UPI002E1FF30F|nr:FtsW/RodA/SpoVE family cell cycle protein [Neobacillus mesonae]MED4205696.1 FtsW/RodA/SpoVE family cell cycle protein [Neobacillus mesonae]